MARQEDGFEALLGVELCAFPLPLALPPAAPHPPGQAYMLVP